MEQTRKCHRQGFNGFQLYSSFNWSTPFLCFKSLALGLRLKAYSECIDCVLLTFGSFGFYSFPKKRIAGLCEPLVVHSVFQGIRS